MPRLYLVEFEAQTIAAASGDIDLFSLDAATDKPIELVEVCLGQTTELGDTAEEQLRIRYIRGHTTVGSGGASATPRPATANDAAAGTTARTLDTTVASVGTAINLPSETWNIRSPYQWGPRPQGMGLWTSGAELLVVRLMAAVADDLTASGWCSFYEYP